MLFRENTAVYCANHAVLAQFADCYVKDICHPQKCCCLQGYGRITTAKSLIFFMTTFSVNLTNLTDTLPQSRDQSNSNAPTAQTHCSTRNLPTCDTSLQACQCYLRLELEALWNYFCYKRNSAFYPYTLYVRAPYDSRNKDYFSPIK